jgi:hypothetical protein
VAALIASRCAALPLPVLRAGVAPDALPTDMAPAAVARLVAAVVAAAEAAEDADRGLAAAFRFRDVAEGPPGAPMTDEELAAALEAEAVVDAAIAAEDAAAAMAAAVARGADDGEDGSASDSLSSGSSADGAGGRGGDVKMHLSRQKRRPRRRIASVSSAGSRDRAPSPARDATRDGSGGGGGGGGGGSIVRMALKRVASDDGRERRAAASSAGGGGGGGGGATAPTRPGAATRRDETEGVTEEADESAELDDAVASMDVARAQEAPGLTARAFNFASSMLFGSRQRAAQAGPATRSARARAGGGATGGGAPAPAPALRADVSASLGFNSVRDVTKSSDARQMALAAPSGVRTERAADAPTTPSTTALAAAALATTRSAAAPPPAPSPESGRILLGRASKISTSGIAAAPVPAPAPLSTKTSKSSTGGSVGPPGGSALRKSSVEEAARKVPAAAPAPVPASARTSGWLSWMSGRGGGVQQEKELESQAAAAAPPEAPTEPLPALSSTVSPPWLTAAPGGPPVAAPIDRGTSAAGFAPPAPLPMGYSSGSSGPGSQPPASAAMAYGATAAAPGGRFPPLGGWYAAPTLPQSAIAGGAPAAFGLVPGAYPFPALGQPSAPPSKPRPQAPVALEGLDDDSEPRPVPAAAAAVGE